MDEQRERARSGAESATEDRHGAVISFVGSAPESRFVGYETLDALTSVAAAAPVETASSTGRRRGWSSSRRARSTPRAAARSPTRAS